MCSLSRIVFSSLLVFTFFLVNAAHAAVILQYHRISDTGPVSTRTSPAQFAEHVYTIKQLGYKVIGLEVLAGYLRAKQPLPDKTVVITFDDAYSSVYTEAAPLLLKEQWPFTIFVSPKDITPSDATSSFMTWQQLRELSSKKVIVANHSLRHSHMIRRLQEETEPQWRDRVRADIVSAEQKIKQEIGSAPRYFAYPYGEYDPALEQVLADLNYLAVTQHSGPVGSHDELQALPRFPFGGVYGGDDFSVKLQTLPIPIAEVNLLDEGGERLPSWVLPVGVVQPVMTLKVRDADWLQATNARQLQCFSSGQGAVAVSVQTTEKKYRAWTVQLNRAVPVGRSRINCTMAADGGRFYWFSQLLIRRNDDGSWYDEP